MYHEPTNGQLPLLAEIKPPAAVDPAVVASFGESEEVAIKRAVVWAWEHRRIQAMSQRRAAGLCGMKNSHFSNMLAGKKYLPAQKINAFEALCGNTAVSQTIERFRVARERAMVNELSQLLAQHLGGRVA